MESEEFGKVNNNSGISLLPKIKSVLKKYRGLGKLV
jgi:hypothetical protein